MQCKAYNKTQPVQLYGTSAEPRSCFGEPHFFFNKKQFWKPFPPKSSGFVLQMVLKAAEDTVPDKIPEFCAYGFLLLLPSHLYFNRLPRRRAITSSWSKQSHYHLFFTGPSLQLSLMEWQRIPRTFGSTTYKINLEYLVSQEVRGKH